MNPFVYAAPIAVLCSAVSAQQAQSPVQRLDAARLELEALQVVEQMCRELVDPDTDFLLPGVDDAAFLQGFREYFSGGDKQFHALLLRYHKEARAWVLGQIQSADFLTPHAAQPGVVKLENGLQYDAYILPELSKNYKARRARELQVCVPGTRISLGISGLPLVVGEAMYDAPRGVAWRFLLPVELLDPVDAQPLMSAGVRTVEIVAVRESLSQELREEARAHFAAARPALPDIQLENPELHILRSRLRGMQAACCLEGDGTRLMARIQELLPELDKPGGPIVFRERMKRAQREYDAAHVAVQRLERQQVAEQILKLLEETPGSCRLSNGIICTALPGEPIQLQQARYVESEELGSENYWRVRERIVAVEADLPVLLVKVAGELPAGAGWDVVIPPSLLGEEHDLPMLYRIRAGEAPKLQETPVLPPDVI